MFVRIVALTLVLAGAALVAPLDHAETLPQVTEPVVADHGNTCEGWPQIIHDTFEECPHGPTI